MHFTSPGSRRIAAAVALAAALVAAALALLRSDEAAAKPAQAITLTPRSGAFGATGLTGLRAGFVRVTVRNATDAPHGVLLLRLKRDVTTDQVVRAVAANDPERSRPLFSHIGGIQVVAPGRSWEMTAELAAGRYVALDFGDSDQPRVRSFRVARGGHGSPPRTVGKFALVDNAFHSTLPKHFSGRGVVEIPNLGSEWHEISLVRTPAGKTASDVLGLLHAGGDVPPEGSEVNELLWVLEPGRTAYVRFDLEPGHTWRCA